MGVYTVIRSVSVFDCLAWNNTVMQTPLNGRPLNTDTSLIRTVFFVPAENSYIFSKFNPLNPLSPNIHKQILQTDLYTSPYRISWEKLIKDQRFFSLWSFD